MTHFISFSLTLPQIAKTMAQLMNVKNTEESTSQVLKLKVVDASKHFTEEVTQQRYEIRQ